MASSRRQVECFALALWLFAGLYVGAEARVLAVRPLSPTPRSAVLVGTVGGGGGRGAAGQSRRRRRAVTAQALEGLAALRAEAARLVSGSSSPAIALASISVALALPPSLDDGLASSFSLDGFDLDGGAGHETGQLEESTNATTNRSGMLPFEQLDDGPLEKPLRRSGGDAEGLELRLPGTSLRELHERAKESVAEFLLLVQNCLNRGVHVDAHVTTLTERFRLDTTEGQQKKHNAVVVVKLKAKQFLEGTNMSAHEMAEVLTAQLDDQKCALFSSDFGFAMKHASVRPSSALHVVKSKGGPANMQVVSAMFLPILASAVFTGILLWLAAR